MGGTIRKRPRRAAGGEDDRVACRTPTPGGKPTRIERWKFEAVRGAILDAVKAEDDGLPFVRLNDAVRARLTPEERTYLGSVGWYAVTVKLELEVAGELKRARVAGRQVLLPT
jgi:hypothetical protein